MRMSGMRAEERDALGAGARGTLGRSGTCLGADAAGRCAGGDDLTRARFEADMNVVGSSRRTVRGRRRCDTRDRPTTCMALSRASCGDPRARSVRHVANLLACPFDACAPANDERCLGQSPSWTPLCQRFPYMGGTSLALTAPSLRAAAPARSLGQCRASAQPSRLLHSKKIFVSAMNATSAPPTDMSRPAMT